MCKYKKKKKSKIPQSEKNHCLLLSMHKVGLRLIFIQNIIFNILNPNETI